MKTKIHRAARLYAREHLAGQLDRREFLSRSTMLGVSAAAAYGLIGAAVPTPARAAPTKGGVLRVNMETKALKDPRTWDWTELSNFCRGWLDYLTLFNRDGTVTGSLCESWEVSDDAKTYTLALRQGVKWNNGDDFTTEDVLHNFRRWADGAAEGNSMASRVSALQDPDTQQLRDGAVEVLDDHRMRLHLIRPDISVMAGLSDYPAAVTHRSYQGGDPSEAPIGTGAYLPAENKIGERQVLVRNPDHDYWRDGGWLDRIEFIDLGTDQASVMASADSDEIDLTYRTDGDFVEALDGVGWSRSEVVTANTIAIRFNQASAPYDDREVRRALQLAVDNGAVLDLAINGLGLIGENHHVCPIHPEYAEGAPLEVDPDKALSMLEAAGHADAEFDLISVDTEWQANACNAVAGALRSAGINVKRTVLPGSTFWNDWLNYPFSATEWGPRPLGIQIMALAYKSGVAWNETSFSNAEFDALLDEGLAIADVDKRREVMGKMQKIMQDEGVVIQPFWRSIFNHSNGKFANVDIHPFYQLDLHDIHLKA